MIVLASSCTNTSKKETVESIEELIPVPFLSGVPQFGELIDTSRQLESISYPLLVTSNDTIEFNILEPFEHN